MCSLLALLRYVRLVVHMNLKCQQRQVAASSNGSNSSREAEIVAADVVSLSLLGLCC